MKIAARHAAGLNRALDITASLAPATAMAFAAWTLAGHIGWATYEAAIAAGVWALCGGLIGRSTILLVQRYEAKAEQRRVRIELAVEGTVAEDNPIHRALTDLESAIRELPSLNQPFEIADMPAEGLEELLLEDSIEEDVLELIEMIEKPRIEAAPLDGARALTADNRVVQLFGEAATPAPEAPDRAEGEARAKVALADALADIRRSLQA